MIWENNCQKYPNAHERAQDLQEVVNTNPVQSSFWGCWPKPFSFMGKEHLVLQLSTGPWRNTSSKPRKHPYTTQAVPHRLESPWRAPVGREELQLVWYQEQKCTRHRPWNVSQGPWPLAWSLGHLEVSGMGQIMQTASCSWRHIVSWRNEDTGTVWVTWLGLGHEAIVKMGRKYNCKSKNCKNTHEVGFNMGKVHAKGHGLETTKESLLPNLWWFSTSEWREQWQCPKSELSPRYQATQI